MHGEKFTFFLKTFQQFLQSFNQIISTDASGVTGESVSADVCKLPWMEIEAQHTIIPECFDCQFSVVFEWEIFKAQPEQGNPQRGTH